MKKSVVPSRARPLSDEFVFINIPKPTLLIEIRDLRYMLPTLLNGL